MRDSAFESTYQRIHQSTFARGLWASDGHDLVVQPRFGQSLIAEILLNIFLQELTVRADDLQDGR